MAKKKAASTPVKKAVAKKAAVKKVAVKKVVAKKATGKKAPASGKKKSPKSKLDHSLVSTCSQVRDVKYKVQLLFQRGRFYYYLRTNCDHPDVKNIMVSQTRYNDTGCDGTSYDSEKTNSELSPSPLFRWNSTWNYEIVIE